LREFIQLFDFVNLDFDSAIRLFLSAFQISGEGQIVDRIFEAFARVYFASHPSSGIASPEALHLLAYGWLLLHTSFHNNNVTKKPTFEDFQKMLAKQNGSSDFDADLLLSLYRSVKSSMIAFEDAQQLNTLGFWRFLVQRGRVLHLPSASPATQPGAARTGQFFSAFWDAHAAGVFALFEAGRDAFVSVLLKKLITLAASYQLTFLLDQTVRRFCQLAIDDLSQDAGTGSLVFLVFVVNEHGSCVREGWLPYVDVLATLFQLDLVPADLLTFADVSEDGRPTVLSHRLVATKRFSFFR
jgi:brefeldin A-resistance guanine nucleotide exchange factor 1